MTVPVKTIILQGKGVPFESLAAAAISPGFLIERASATTVQAHSSADAVAQKLFAKADWPANKEALTDTTDTDQNYAAADNVQCEYVHSGMLVWAILDTSNVAVVGSPLVSSGDGSLKITTVAATTLEGALVAYAEEAVTTTAAQARIRVRIA